MIKKKIKELFYVALGSLVYTSSVWYSIINGKKGGYYSLSWYLTAFLTILIIALSIAWYDDTNNDTSTKNK